MHNDDEFLRKHLKDFEAAQAFTKADEKARADIAAASGQQDYANIKAALGGIDPAEVLRIQGCMEQLDRQEAQDRWLPSQEQINMVTGASGLGDALAQQDVRPDWDRLAEQSQTVQNNRDAIRAMIRDEVKAEVKRQLDERDGRSDKQG